MPRTLPLFAFATFGAAIVLTGCSHRAYVYAGPPAPPPPAVDPMARLASSNGFHDGRMLGRADAERGLPYAPRHNAYFHDVPGWQPGMGPHQEYRDAYRNAFLHGYNESYGYHG